MWIVLHGSEVVRLVHNEKLYGYGENVRLVGSGQSELRATAKTHTDG